MKKAQKIINIIMIAFMLVATISNVVLATDKEVNFNPNQYKGTSTDVSGINNIGNQIITIVSTVGSIASVIVLVVLGLKYMMGSAEEKAEYKKTLLPYIIGAALVFAASSIASMIFGFTSQLGASK